MSFVNTVDLIGDEALTNSIIDRSITEIADNVVVGIGKYAFKRCMALQTAHFGSVTSIGEYAFDWCTALTKARFDEVTRVWSYAFRACSKLKTVDISGTAEILTNAFQNCSALNELILRSMAMSTIANANALSNTAISQNKGYIYVPRALVDSYKAATNWSTYAAQFRALEDYTVDGTTTGELDPTKI